MFINVKKLWFDPSGNRRLPRGNPHEVPKEWKDLLPKGTEILEKKEETALKKAEKEEAEAKA